MTFGVGIAAIDSFGHGEPVAIGLLEFAVAATAGATLIWRETHMTEPPLLPVDLLRIPIFGLSIATSIASFSAAAWRYAAATLVGQNLGALRRNHQIAVAQHNRPAAARPPIPTGTAEDIG